MYALVAIGRLHQGLGCLFQTVGAEKMKTYIVKIDGQFYCGEGEEYKTQILPSANGFHQPTNHGTSGIRLSQARKDARQIQSVRNIMSHLNKILRCTEPVRLEIIEEVKKNGKSEPS